MKQLGRIQKASRVASHDIVPFGLASLFLLTVFYAIHSTMGEINNSTVLMLAGILGGYMALNQGAKKAPRVQVYDLLFFTACRLK